MMFDITVLVPVRDLDGEHARTTRRCLRAASEAIRRVRGELLIVDDDSPCVSAYDGDGSRGAATRMFRNPGAPGLVSALNYGAAQSRGRLLTYCHSDCLLGPGTVENIVCLFRDPRVGLCASELRYEDGTLQQCGGWVGPGFTLAWDTTISDGPRPTHWGDLWTVRRTLFRRCGGLPMCYNPGYWECVDLATRVRHLGYQVMTCAGTPVLHFKSRTFHRVLTADDRRDLFERNRLLFTTRWRRHERWITEGGPSLQPDGGWR